MRIVLDKPGGAIHRWAVERIPHYEGTDDDVTLGVMSQDRLLAAFIYSGRTKAQTTINLAAISPKWCHPDVLGSVFSYAFNELGHKRITAMIDINNERSLRLTKGVGFTQEGVAKEILDKPKGHVAFLRLLKAEFERGKFANRRLS